MTLAPDPRPRSGSVGKREDLRMKTKTEAGNLTAVGGVSQTPS
jgi:hypothetical protein